MNLTEKVKYDKEWLHELIKSFKSTDDTCRVIVVGQVNHEHQVDYVVQGGEELKYVLCGQSAQVSMCIVLM